MATIQYGDLIPQPGTFEVTGMGTQPGPVGGDGWQIAALLPQARLPAGTSRYVLMCHFKVGNIRVSGATPSRGIIQVCLGLDTGGIAPTYRFQISVTEALGQFEGIPGFFMMVQCQSPSIVDPFFGATFNNASGAQFCLHARTFWNGDTPAYAVAFDITDVTWFWWDTGRIPSTDFLCDVYDPTTPVSLTSTLAGIHVATNSPGLVGQKWLHFQAIEYEPPRGAATLQSPSFRFGWSPTPGGFSGFTAKVGTNGRWGQQRNMAAAASETPRLHQGCFWYLVRPSGVFLPALMGQERHSLGAPSDTRVHRSAYFGVRLDNLLDVLVRTEEEVANATCNLFSSFPPYPEVYVPLERSATGIIAWPVAIAHGIVQTTGRQSFDLTLQTDTFRVLDFMDSAAQNDGTLQEGVSCMAFAQQGLGATSGDIQYRAIFLGGPNAPPVSLNVRDITILQFYPIRDPDVIANQPPGVGAPLVLVPGRESANPASLPALPITPDAEQPEDASLEFARIDGATGYSRTWPLFGKVRRQWTLTWSRLSEANGVTLYDFLRDNPAVRFRPQRGLADVAAVQITAPELAQISAQVYSLSVRVVELVWTS